MNAGLLLDFYKCGIGPSTSVHDFRVKGILSILTNNVLNKYYFKDNVQLVLPNTLHF